MIPKTVSKIVLREKITPTYDKQNAMDQAWIISSRYDDIRKILPIVGVGIDQTLGENGYTHVFIHFSLKG